MSVKDLIANEVKDLDPLQINAHELAKKYNVSLPYIYLILGKLGKGKKRARTSRIMSELIDEVNKRVAISKEELIKRGLLGSAERLVKERRILKVRIVCKDKRARLYYCSRERLEETAIFVYENYDPDKRNIMLMYRIPFIIYDTMVKLGLFSRR